MRARHEGAGAAPRSAVSCHRWRPRVSGVGEPYAWRLLPRQPRIAPVSVNTGGEFFQRSSTSEPGIQLIQLGYVCYRTQLPWISSICCCNLPRRRAISVGWQSGPPGSCQRQVSSPRSPMTRAVFCGLALADFSLRRRRLAQHDVTRLAFEDLQGWRALGRRCRARHVQPLAAGWARREQFLIRPDHRASYAEWSRNRDDICHTTVLQNLDIGLTSNDMGRIGSMAQEKDKARNPCASPPAQGL